MTDKKAYLYISVIPNNVIDDQCTWHSLENFYIPAAFKLPYARDILKTFQTVANLLEILAGK